MGGSNASSKLSPKHREGKKLTTSAVGNSHTKRQQARRENATSKGSSRGWQKRGRMGRLGDAKTNKKVISKKDSKKKKT